MAKTRINIQSDEKAALRGAAAGVKALAEAVDTATSAQIAAAIAGIGTLPEARQALLVLALRSREQEKRLRALERRR